MNHLHLNVVPHDVTARQVDDLCRALEPHPVVRGRVHHLHVLTPGQIVSRAIYIYRHIYIFMYVYIYIYIYTCIHVDIYIYMHIYVYTCTNLYHIPLSAVAFTTCTS